MSDLNINSSSTDPVVTQVVTLTQDNTSVKTSSDVINVSRSSGEWVPVTFNEIPISSNTLNIAINSGDIRPTLTAIASNTRTIAPKPVMTTTTIPIRQETIGGEYC